MATFNELQLDIADRMNLSSDDALARIFREINTRYRRVTSSLGLDASRRVVRTADATIGERDLTFSSMEHLEAVYIEVNGENKPLKEITHTEMLTEPLVGEPPSKYAVTSITATSVTVTVNCVPTTAFTLVAVGLNVSETLAGVADSPAIPESFHDILIYGVLADEYRKKEKFDLMRESELVYEQRLADLRMFLAKSAFLEITQGKHAAVRRNPFNRLGPSM